MNREEITQLLVIVISYDRRPPSEADLHAWQEASERTGWTYHEAAEAVHEHYANSSVMMMPGNVTQAIRDKQIQDEPYPRRYDSHRDDNRSGVATPERVREIMAQIYRERGWKEKIESVEAWRNETCPHPPCHAAPGQPCRTPMGQPLRFSACHPSREDLAKQHREEATA